MENTIKTLKQIEELEYKYLDKFYHFLKYSEEEMLEGFNTKEKIKNDWYDKYKSGISDFAVGAERIVYALFNGKGIGQPNSTPVGSDLFFETKDAFIHIDLKTVQTRNIGDYNNSIFVGNNQNSYTGTINTKNGNREYKGNLPAFYTLPDGTKKICLTYFVTILYEDIDLKIININMLCMPNGSLSDTYKDEVLKAGKNPDKIRYSFSNIPDFKLLEGNKKRIRVIYLDKTIDTSIRKHLSFIENIENKN